MTDLNDLIKMKRDLKAKIKAEGNDVLKGYFKGLLHRARRYHRNHVVSVRPRLQRRRPVHLRYR
jgi:hypothetical protein